MNGLLWNVLLALAWAAVTGSFAPTSLVIGFALGFALLLFTQRAVGAPTYGRRVGRAVMLLLYFLWELTLANLRVAYDVLTPRHHMRPGVVAIPLDARSDGEITLLASMITLTPGSFALDVSANRRTLYVHAMYIDGGDLDLFRRRLKHGFERRLLEVTR
ncbi:MAG: Na+/H+ antiporter subunit E [Dehalococcoidia bacterium]